MKKWAITLFLTVTITLLGLVFLSGTAYARISSQEALHLVSENLKFTSADEIAVPIQENFSHLGDRDELSITLNSPETGPIRLLVNGPAGFQDQRSSVPILFVSAGFLTGKDSIRLLSNPGSLILVGYEYPASAKEISADPSLLPKLIRIVPSQMALSLEWLSRQLWAEPHNIHVLGVSLGSLFLPISLRLAQMRGIYPRSTIFAYGGSDIETAIDRFLPQEWPEWVRSSVQSVMSGITTLHDPALHLPYLNGKFLCIYGTEDELFSRESSLKQFNLLSGAKEIQWIDGPHIDVNQPVLIQKTSNFVRHFIEEMTITPQ